MSVTLQNGSATWGFDLTNSGFIFDFGGAAAIDNSNPRFGVGQAARFNGGASGGVNINENAAQLFEGLASYCPSIPVSGWTIYREWYDATAGAVQVSLQVGSSGQFQFFQGSGTGTPIGPASAANAIRLNQWQQFQVHIIFNASTGKVELLDANSNVLITTAATQNTAPTGNAWCSRVYFFGVQSGSYWDDWYIADGTGPAPLNTYWGNVAVRGDVPNSDASPNQFSTQPTQTTGNHYKNVDTISPNGTAYNYDNNPGDEELYGYPSITGVKVLAINIWMSVELDAAGPRTVETVLVSSSVVQLGTPFTPTNTFSFYNTLSATDPNTAASWASGTVAAAQAAQLGIKVVS